MSAGTPRTEPFLIIIRVHHFVVQIVLREPSPIPPAHITRPLLQHLFQLRVVQILLPLRHPVRNANADNASRHDTTGTNNPTGWLRRVFMMPVYTRIHQNNRNTLFCMNFISTGTIPHPLRRTINGRYFFGRLFRRIVSRQIDPPNTILFSQPGHLSLRIHTGACLHLFLRRLK